MWLPVDEELRSPLLDHDPGEPPVFLPGNLLEAAALLALGRALDKPVVCLAHVTNTMATRTENFEKGGDTGLEEALKVCELALEVALEQAGDKEKK